MQSALSMAEQALLTDEERQPCAIGVDVGSTTCKVVVINAKGTVLQSRVEPSQPTVEAQSTRMVAQLCAEAGVTQSLPVGATGYGRKRVAATRTLTEITCHAKGAFWHTRQAGMLIDIGGQDTKVIRIDDHGRVVDFAMNDKCAAGTGRFLEVVFARLGLSYEEVAKAVTETADVVGISSTCAVFAESEVVSLLARGAPIAGILKGLHHALSARVLTLVGTVVKDSSALLLSGGVALNSAMRDALAQTANASVTVVPEPQLVGALGAALSVLSYTTP